MDEVAQMEVVRELTNTEGWALVEQFITSKVDDHRKQLMTCKLEDVMKHRHKAEALESVLLYVQEVITKGQEALETQI